MNRRSFISMLLAAAAAEAVDSAIPLNRVWSFPSQIVIPTAQYRHLEDVFYNRAAIDRLQAQFRFVKSIGNKYPLPKSGKTIRFAANVV